MRSHTTTGPATAPRCRGWGTAATAPATQGYYAEGLKCLPLLADGGGGDGGPKDADTYDAGPDDTGMPDAGIDTGTPDAGVDAGFDAGPDAGVELCDDGKKNGNETDTDCGGPCCPCPDGKNCISGNDCVGKSCKAGKCQAPSCGDGTKNGQECGVDCGGPCSAQCATEKIILDVFDGSAPCSGPCSRDVQGPQPENGGWTPVDGNSRLVYDFGRHVDCGRLVVEVDNFRPHDQFQPRDMAEPYTEFMPLFDGLEDNPNDRFNHYSDFSQIDVVYRPHCFRCAADPNFPGCECCTDQANCPSHCTDGCMEPNHSRIKPNSGLLTACDWDSGRYCNDCMQEGKTHNVFELRWTPQGLSLYVDGAEQTYYPYPVYPNPSCTFTCRPKTPELRYLYVNRPGMNWQGYLVGPKYVRVELEAPVEQVP
ncbi:MAG: hypothetical protein HY897_04180 [Deltaproteobacteria bacterium]|nr:hypothetical protein [Deltaproteobacteria bacterium]